MAHSMQSVNDMKLELTPKSRAKFLSSQVCMFDAALMQTNQIVATQGAAMQGEEGATCWQEKRNDCQLHAIEARGAGLMTIRGGNNTCCDIATH